MSRPVNLETRYRWVLVATVLLFSGVLGAGLLLYLVDPASAVASTVLQAGLLLLIASPAARLAVAAAERVRRGDTTMLLMMAVVVGELLIVMWRAFSKG